MKRALSLLGYAFGTVPPALCVLEYFPLWIQSGEKRLSCFALVLLALCFVPALRLIRRHLKTPSALVFWLLLFLFVCVFRAVMDELFVISLVALSSSVPGTACLFIARRMPFKK